MKNITLSDITQEQFDVAAETVISGVKAYNRKLDTREGTVLRDLLVDPEAAIESVVTGQIDEVRASSSLKRMQEAQEAGGEVDQDDVNAVLSNFNIKPASGTASAGLVKVVVADGSMTYAVPEDFVFTTVDGLEFAVDSAVVAAANGSATAVNTKLYEGAAGYFFLVRVKAMEIGSAGNIKQGTSLTPQTSMVSFVMAEAYKDFDGGADVQSLDAIIDSIPSGLSIRGFVNKTAVEGMLRSKFDDGDFPIVAVSSVGYGNLAQRRDKHNVFGVGVGGRVDVYVRNFSDIYTITKTIAGEWVQEDGFKGYVLKIPAGTFPGACWIKSVADPFSYIPSESSDSSSAAAKAESEKVLESLAMDNVVRTADVSGTWHDIEVTDGDASEAFNTVWQGFVVRLSDVPPDINAEDSSSGNDEWSAEREFKVTAYCLPQAEELQEYADGDGVRSISTDVVVRCPIICNVSVSASVRYDPKKPMDAASAKTAIRSYINGLGFVGRLTRSEIVQILKNLGAVSVDMPDQNMLWGVLHDAKGARHVLQGDALDVSTIEDGPAMVSKDTVVFAAEEPNIQIELTPNS